MARRHCPLPFAIYWIIQEIHYLKVSRNVVVKLYQTISFSILDRQRQKHMQNGFGNCSNRNINSSKSCWKFIKIEKESRGNVLGAMKQLKDLRSTIPKEQRLLLFRNSDTEHNSKRRLNIMKTWLRWYSKRDFWLLVIDNCSVDSLSNGLKKDQNMDKTLEKGRVTKYVHRIAFYSKYILTNFRFTLCCSYQPLLLRVWTNK